MYLFLLCRHHWMMNRAFKVDFIYSFWHKRCIVVQFMCTPATITVIGGFDKWSKYHIVALEHHNRKPEDNVTKICEATWVLVVTTGAGAPSCNTSLEPFPSKADTFYGQVVNKILVFQTCIRYREKRKKRHHLLHLTWSWPHAEDTNAILYPSC